MSERTRQKRPLTVMIALALTLTVFARGLIGQAVPLPADMIATYDPYFGASPLAMTVTATTGTVIIRAGFNNSADKKTVDMLWGFGTATTEWHTRLQTEPTSFEPTAVAPRAGTSDRIYVAGWNERLASVVVEEWAFSGVHVLGPPITPGWEPADAQGVAPVFAEPRIQRNLLFTCDSIPPILDISCNDNGDELLLLARSGDMSRVVYSYSLSAQDPRCTGIGLASAGTPPAVLDSTAVPELAGTYSFWQGQREDAGFFVFVSERRAWKPFPYDTSQVQVVLLRDSGEDGVFETLSTMTLAGFFDEYPYEEFDYEYQ